MEILKLCFGYLFFYVITGIAVKYFQSPADLGFPGMGEAEFLVYSTFGGNALCLAVVLALNWPRFKDSETGRINFGWRSEFNYLVPSGICTAIVIPTTTLMYSLPISVMVAMVIMRGSVIVISRVVDFIQIRQGILNKKVTWEENVAVLFAIAAVALKVFISGGSSAEGRFDFLTHPAAMTILGAYILAYALRIYIMNYFKNRGAGQIQKGSNHYFFAWEQIFATAVLALVAGAVWLGAEGSTSRVLVDFRNAFIAPKPEFGWALLAGAAYGMVAFFSVFIFLLKGKTATFAGLVNRLTSLIAGTAATLVVWYLGWGKGPSQEDWMSLALILIAVGLLARSEKKATHSA